MNKIHENKMLGKIGRILSIFSIILIFGSLLLSFNKIATDLYFIACIELLLIWLEFLIISVILIFPLFIKSYRSFLLGIPKQLFQEDIGAYILSLSENYGLTLIIITTFFIILSTIFLFFDNSNKKSEKAFYRNIILFIIFIIGSVIGFIL